MKSHDILHFLFLLLFFVKPTIAGAQPNKENPQGVTQAGYALLQSETLINAGKYEEALKLVSDAKDVINKVSGYQSLLAGSAWAQLGKIYFHQRKFSDALVALDSNLIISTAIFGQNAPFLGPSCGNIAAVLYELGAYERANTYLERALSVDGDETLRKCNYYIGLGNNYINLGNFEKSLYYFHKSLEISLKLPDAEISTADCYNGIASVYRFQGNYEEALSYFNQALKIYKHTAGNIGVFRTMTTLGNLGGMYSNIGDFHNAVAIHKEVLEAAIKNLGKEHPDLANCYNNLGLDYSGTGDYNQALRYFELALFYFQKNLPPGHPHIATAYANLGNAYSNMAEFDLAIANIKKGLKIREEASPNARSTEINGYNNLAYIYTGLKQFDQAIEYYNLALENQKQAFGEIHPTTITLYNNLGNAYQGQNERDKATQAHLKALDIAAMTMDSNHPIRGISLSALGENYCRMGRFQEAESAFMESLRAFNYSNSISLDQVNDLKNLLYSLNRLGYCYLTWYSLEKQTSQLYKARSWFVQAIAAIDYQLQRLSPASKSTLSAQAGEILSGAINVNYLLHQATGSAEYLEEAFHCSERAKAFLLYEAMQEATALQIAGIPDELLQKEYKLRVEIAHWDKQRQEYLSKGLSQTDSLVLETSFRLEYLQQDYEDLKKNFEADFPKYFEAKYNHSTVSVQTVQQKLLESDQTLLEYTIGDSSIFVFIVQKDKFGLVEIPRDFSLDTLIREMTRDGIYGFHVADEDQLSEQVAATNYTQAAVRLYEKLVAPIKARFNLTERLMIIPDGILGYIPFEALLTHTPSRTGTFASYPYLLKDHRISYNYSATLLGEMKQNALRPNASENLLAMAPFYFDDPKKIVHSPDISTLLPTEQRDNLVPLKYSGQEITDISALWSRQARPLFGKEASLKQFLQLSGNYRILHLSTHGEADERVGDYAYLAFSLPDSLGLIDKLYARDLYTLSLKADLVTLSACETGTGKLRRGEGIISLARAFAYAGAESILTTLWKVNDAQTRELMVAFYRQLKVGSSKDLALWAAKSAYLKKRKGKDDSGAHPFYWAGFIAIGDMSALR